MPRDTPQSIIDECRGYGAQVELVEGVTLRQAAVQGLQLGRILGIARQVAEALAVAHAAQIVHRAPSRFSDARSGWRGLEPRCCSA